MTEHGVSFDRFGIPPDICIATFSDTELEAGNDAAMDTARRLIVSGETVRRADLTTPPTTT